MISVRPIFVCSSERICPLVFPSSCHFPSPVPPTPGSRTEDQTGAVILARKKRLRNDVTRIIGLEEIHKGRLRPSPAADLAVPLERLRLSASQLPSYPPIAKTTRKSRRASGKPQKGSSCNGPKRPAYSGLPYQAVLWSPGALPGPEGTWVVRVPPRINILP